MVRTLSDRQRWTTCGILLGAWLVMAVSMAAAQEVDSRWAPWMGCWRAVDETAEAPLAEADSNFGSQQADLPAYSSLAVNS